MWYKIRDISSDATKQWKSILLIYLVQLVLGIIVAMTAYNQFDGAIGESVELDRLSKGFDRSIFSDMVNDFPSIIGQVQSRFVLVVLLFLLLSVFLHSGLLGNIRNREYSISSFIRNAKTHFLKFFGVVLISVFKAVIVLAIIWVPFFRWLDNPLETFRTEKTFILTVIGLVILSILLIIIIWLWSVLSRYQIVDGDPMIKGMKNGWRELKSSFRCYYTVGVGMLLLHVLITWLYTLAVDDWGAETWFCVLGLISIQQIFSIVRIWLRSFAYSAVDYFSSSATK